MTHGNRLQKCVRFDIIFTVRGVAQFGSALGSGPRGRGFKSRRPTGFEGGGASGERAVCARIARKHIGWAQTEQPGGLMAGLPQRFCTAKDLREKEEQAQKARRLPKADAREIRLAPTRARRQRRKSRRLDQDPEMAFLPSRGLCCCERFEPQPPKRLEMRRFILGCRFTRVDACVREAIEPLIKTSTFRLPVEAKMIPSPRPKPPQRLLSAEVLFVLRFVHNVWSYDQTRSFSGLPRRYEYRDERKKRQTSVPRFPKKICAHFALPSPLCRVRKNCSP